MSEWVAGYRAALADIRRLSPSRGTAAAERTLTQIFGYRGGYGPEEVESLTAAIIAITAALITDLDGDALVIEREQDNRLRRRRLTAAREALPLFDPVLARRQREGEP